MIDSLIGWLTGEPAAGGDAPQDELRVALAALLVEAAHSHDHFDEQERAVVARLLEHGSICHPPMR